MENNSINDKDLFPIKRDGDYFITTTEPHIGYLEYFLFVGKIRPISVKDGLEYGIVGTRRTKGRANNTYSGYIGYKIENGVVYITRFSSSPVTIAQKWVRAAIRDRDYNWIRIGKLRDEILENNT